VVVADINEAGARDVAAEASARGATAIAHRVDVVEREQVEAVVAATVSEYGQLDGLVNLAYWHKGAVPLIELEADDLARELHVDVVGCLVAMQAVYPHLRERGGSIVNFSSAAGVEGLAERAAYSAAKAGVRLLSRTAALEWGRDQIRVNTVCPFSMSESLAAAVAAGTVDQAHLDGVSPLGRPGDPEHDVGAGVAFLLSDDSRYLTGHTIALDGGGLAL
jgi:NAD(P)-dependent dehydrogenase (short-subunit alcohol dehydrogenase family)